MFASDNFGADVTKISLQVFQNIKAKKSIAEIQTNMDVFVPEGFSIMKYELAFFLIG